MQPQNNTEMGHELTISEAAIEVQGMIHGLEVIRNAGVSVGLSLRPEEDGIDFSVDTTTGPKGSADIIDYRDSERLIKTMGIYISWDLGELTVQQFLPQGSHATDHLTVSFDQRTYEPLTLQTGALAAPDMAFVSSAIPAAQELVEKVRKHAHITDAEIAERRADEKALELRRNGFRRI